MSIRSITVLFEGSGKEYAALHQSLDMAKEYNAHLRCLHISPNLKASYYPGMDVMPAEGALMIEEIEKSNRQQAEKALQTFEHCLQRANIPLVNDGDIPAHHPSASFSHYSGDIAELIAREGKYTDIIVVERKWAESSLNYDTAITTALFATARPVLFIPPSPPSHLRNVITIAWNESTESARALTAAMPFLRLAEKVNIVSVERSGNKIDGLEPLKGYLKIHGVMASAYIIKKENGHSTSGLLLKKAQDLDTSLLVMGAYTHSRTRQKIFGGVTSLMLEKADIPLLMIH